MTNKERKQLIENTLRDYNAAKQSGDADKIARAINDMENVYICVSPWSVEGAETLRQAIVTAKNEKKLTPGEIYAAAVATLPAEDIDHHNSDLYLRKTPEATALVNRLTTKVLLSVFRDQDGATWYELPLCFSPYWENPSKFY